MAEYDNNIVAGFIIGQPINIWQAKIISLAVDPEFHNKGIGRALCNSLINQLKTEGFKEVLLHVHVRTNNTPSLSFYKKLEFEIIKTIKKYYQDGGDAYLMKFKIQNTKPKVNLNI